MAALLTDPVWTRISRFGTPYPPFDYNSGMGVRSLPRSECLSLGLITEDWRPPATSPHDDFNASLTATLDFTPSDRDWEKLKDDFKDQLVYTKAPDGTTTLTWRAHLIRDAFSKNPGGNGAISRLGAATDAALATAPADLVPLLKGKNGERMGLTITKELVTHTKKHRHFIEDPRRTNDPVTPQDLDIVPALWRSPDRILPGDDDSSIVFELDLLTGGTLVLPLLRAGNTLLSGTLYKRKKDPET